MNNRSKKHGGSQVTYLLSLKVKDTFLINSLSYDSYERLFNDLKVLFRSAPNEGIEVIVKQVDESVPFPEVEHEEV